MRPLIAGNWKMNGTGHSLAEIAAVAEHVAAGNVRADVLICPPFTLLSRAVATAEGRFAIGAQDCHAQVSGAFTGDVSATMIRDAGAMAVIVGHSERRHYHHETNAMVAAKAEAAWRAGLMAIICIGETGDERDQGRADEVVLAQIEGSVPAAARAGNTAIAYEPIWAIGTGLTPSGDDIATMHGIIRESLQRRCHGEGERIRILYGGSANPGNARGILALANVNGALVGGASLKAEDFMGIIRAVPRV
ncbi:MAG TPA: triose-phosphate isomerase [Rhizomicrobium sp.]|jgi:triosephosphate isomerase|nr:triose-phosphate isomerase [Rhizomicrobium sp.]